ncbi:hypothetical protein PYCCODRAFT_1374292 [Trametes coccinea BRFM310]|uniref:Aminoglycoside phosphotransferase domain-containing protein n=1 Tax=Trametes coccinea (strain BRFM310) TaxID=1353009 RepID=A0A1Y2IEC4_TRAC3|nr:hypothetical protein PYCCODRAFT_1374292 [Trametes coccinea BRFM310]
MAEVTLEDVQRILDQHRGGSTTIADFKPLHRTGFEIFTPTKSYAVTVDDGTSYILKATPPASAASVTYAPNTLATEHALLKLLSSQTGIPHPTIHTLDTSHNIVPFSYLLLSHPRGVTLSAARASGKLSPRQAALLDLRTGAYLKQLHDVQNDWFGLPSQEHDALYSWQEAFTPLLEGLLEDAQKAGIDLPYEDVRRYLSRAIGFFLFDDCEVPSLVSFTGDEDAIFVDFDLEKGAPGGEDEEIAVTSFASFSHALWGDPLLETMLLNPSDAFVEGYGGPLIVFGRQKTKRLWYNIFLSLVVVLQGKKSGETENEKVKWAMEMLHKSVAALKDAPCY